MYRLMPRLAARSSAAGSHDGFFAIGHLLVSDLSGQLESLKQFASSLVFQTIGLGSVEFSLI